MEAVRNIVIGLLPVLALSMAGCDSAPGTGDDASAAPIVSDLAYDPEMVLLSQLPPSDVMEDSVRFAVTVEVRAHDADGEIREVAYAVQPPSNALRPVSSGTLERINDDRYGATFPVSVPRGGVGKYSVVVFAVDNVGRVSNTLRALIDYQAEGRPPVIREVIADPDTIRVDRDSVLTLTAVVDDPDGLANISSVRGTAPNGEAFNLHDDGESRGDPVAGDGRYTARFGGVDAATPNTTQLFRIQAFDRTGLASEIVEKAVRIE